MATLQVPGSYATITLALAAAANDDTINIAADTYSEEITCGSLTGVTIQGATGRPEDVIITSDGSVATVLMNTDCTLKNVTVHLDMATPAGGSGFDDISAIMPVSSTKVYHVQNTHIYSNRNGVTNQAAGSTLDRCIIKWTGPAHLILADANKYANAALYPGAGTCTSCLLVGWPNGVGYADTNNIINCTYTTAVNGWDGAYGFYVTTVYNSISHLDSGSLAISQAAGYSLPVQPSYGMRTAGNASDNISHAWNAAYSDFNIGGTSTNNYDTSAVEAAGNIEALYADLQVPNQSASYDENMRIRYDSLAYRSANTAPSDQPVYDLDGKPFHPTTPSIGCYEYCFGRPTMGVSVRRTSGSLGVGSTYIRSILGVTT